MFGGLAVYDHWVRENISEEEANREIKERFDEIEKARKEAAIKWFDSLSEQERVERVNGGRIENKFLRGYDELRGTHYGK